MALGIPTVTTPLAPPMNAEAPAEAPDLGRPAPSPSRPLFHEAPALDTTTAWAKWWSTYINDPRDIAFINLSLQMTFFLLPAAVALFVIGSFSWWWALGYYAFLYAFFLDRYILMLHCTCHRPLFKKKVKFLNNYIPWVLGPLIGESPEAYFVHHMGMHHREGNLLGDLSTTMPYQRDKFSHWLHYWVRFMVVGMPSLVSYHKPRPKMIKRLLIGELGYWAIAWVLFLFVSWQATLVVLVIPLLAVRTLMMMGNWGQHAFVDPEEPNNDFKSSITCINSRYNRRCFNDGYHIIHHLKPSLHYTEMADEFDKQKDLYGKQDAIVFEGYDFFMVWLLLMIGQKKALAKAFVRLPGAPKRTDEEVIELLNRRLRPFDRLTGQPTPA